MTTLNQPIEPLEFLLSEGDGMISREQVTVTVAGGVAIPAGQVLGKITATSKYVIHNTGAGDGSQNAAAILGYPLAGVNGDYRSLVFVRYCEVIGNRLNNSVAPITATVTALTALGIIVR